jgi:hypothetical protein
LEYYRRKNNMKNYKTRELAKESFLEKLEKLSPRLKKSYYFSNGEGEIIKEILIELLKGKDTNLIKKLLKDQRIHDVSSKHLYFMGYSWGFSFIGSLKEKNKEDLLFDERLFTFVEKQRLHLLDFSNLSLDEIKDLSKIKNLPLFLQELLYEFLISREEYASAKLILDNYFNPQEQFIMKSENSEDFWPIFSTNMSKEMRPSVFKSNLENYLTAVNSSNQMFPVNQKINDIMIKKFKKSFKKMNMSSFLIQKEISNSLEIDKFDILESNSAAVADLLDFSNYWDASNSLKELMKKNEKRLKKVIIDFINREFGLGTKKSKFLRIYSNLKEIGLELDVFMLESKLQSIILLEEIS